MRQETLYRGTAVVERCDNTTGEGHRQHGSTQVGGYNESFATGRKCDTDDSSGDVQPGVDDSADASSDRLS